MIPTVKDMFSSLLRPKLAAARRIDSHLFDSNPPTPSPGPANRRNVEERHATADFTEGEDDEEDDEDNGHHFDLNHDPNHPSIRFADQGDFRRNSNPVIPLFSASHLGLNSNHVRLSNPTSINPKSRFLTRLPCCPRDSNHCPDEN